MDATYADRLRETIARRVKLRSAFTSPLLIEDNERQIRWAQHALSTFANAGADAARSAWATQPP
jgi:hypothetical protein